MDIQARVSDEARAGHRWSPARTKTDGALSIRMAALGRRFPPADYQCRIRSRAMQQYCQPSRDALKAELIGERARKRTSKKT